MSKLSVDFAGVRLRNPMILGSATPSWDGERSNQAWKAGFGGVIPKSFGPPGRWAQHPRRGRMKVIKAGNRPMGMINIELYTTMTLEHWLETELDTAYAGNSMIIASIVAHPDPNGTARNASIIQETGKVGLFEINVSCPMPFGDDKVGFQMGCDPEIVANQVRAVKAVSRLPVGIKLTPTVHNMVPVARAAEEAGADFLTISNSIRSFAGVDIATGRPKLPAYGGYTGPAIKPIIQRHVSEVARAVKIPISAVGGVNTWEDVVEYMMLGASTVQTVTAIMWNGFDYLKTILDGLEAYMERAGISSLEEIRGKALPYIKTIEDLAKEPPLFVTVDPEKCINLTKGGCELCGRSCFYGVISFDPKLKLARDTCDGCGLCTEVCPAKALSLGEK